MRIADAADLTPAIVPTHHKLMTLTVAYDQ